MKKNRLDYQKKLIYETKILRKKENHNYARQMPNGMRYLRWGGDGEAVQPEKGLGVENCLGCA